MSSLEQENQNLKTEIEELKKSLKCANKEASKFYNNYIEERQKHHSDIKKFNDEKYEYEKKFFCLKKSKHLQAEHEEEEEEIKPAFAYRYSWYESKRHGISHTNMWFDKPDPELSQRPYYHNGWGLMKCEYMPCPPDVTPNKHKNKNKIINYKI